MTSDLLSGPHGFHSTSIQAGSQADLHLASGCLLSSSAKTLDDAKAHNWRYVPNIHWWPLRPANLYCYLVT